jgi:hypothetical protein
MRAAALVLLGVVLSSAPVRADFFQDLGFALGKLGEKVEETFSSDRPEPAQPVVQPTPIDPATINWNPVPDDALWLPERPVLPKPKPKAASAYQVTAKADDAPAPKAAPIKPVQTIAALAPLAGYTMAPPRVAPIMPVISLPEPAQVKPALPKSKPTATEVTPAKAPAAYALRYGLNGAQVPDSRKETTASETKIIQAVAGYAKQPSIRLKLISETKGQSNRSLALARALQVKQWLEAAGVRPTQIDLEVQTTGSTETVSLVPYKVP